MKTGFFYDPFPHQKETNDLILDALKAHPDISEILELNSQELVLEMNGNGLKIRFGDFILDKAKVDILIYRGGLSDVNLSVSIAKYCRSQGIFVFDNHLSEVKYLINKKIDTANFTLEGVKMPVTRFFPTYEEILNFEFTYPHIVKGINTGQGKNVFKVDSLVELENAVHVFEAKEKKASSIMFQEFIDYKADLRVFVLGDKVLGAMRRIPKNGEFRANYSLGGDVEVFEASNEIKNSALAAARACNLDYAGVDILIDKEEKLFVLEANRNPQMKGISKALGINVAERFVEFVIGRVKSVV